MPLAGRRGRAADGAAARRQRLRACRRDGRPAGARRGRSRAALRRRPAGGGHPAAGARDHPHRLAPRRRRLPRPAHAPLRPGRAGRCPRAPPDARRLVGRELRLVARRHAHRVLRRSRRARRSRRPRSPCTSCARAAESRWSWRGSRARAGSSPWSPDGAHVAFLGIDEAGEPYGCEDSLWVVPAGGGSPRDLAHGRHLHLYLAGASDLVDWEVEASDALTWDGADAVICPADAGRAECALALSRSRASRAEMPGAGRTCTATRRAPGASSRCARRRPASVDLHLEEAGARRRLTREGSAWQRALTGIACEQVSIPGPAGPIRATVLAPARRRSQGAAAGALDHRRARWELGPRAVAPRLDARGRRCARAACPTRAARRATAAPGWRPSAATGAAPTPRISSPASTGRWGRGSPIPTRLGVTGLSYGGFMTHWLIGQSDRFRAAVAANGVSNQISAAAQLRRGRAVDAPARLGRPPADFERLWQQSPLAHAERITTPLLMLQGEADLRCPASDNEQLFVALRALGAHGRVRALPGRVAPDAVDRPPRPAHRHARAHGALVSRPRRARPGVEPASPTRGRACAMQ